MSFICVDCGFDYCRCPDDVPLIIPEGFEIVISSELTLLRTRLASAEEALKFYLEKAEGMWITYADDWSEEVHALLDDKGKRAREHFSKFKESEK